MLQEQAAVRNLVGHPSRVNAPLHVPAVQVIDRGITEAKVYKLAHFSQLTRARARVGPGWLAADAPGSSHPGSKHNEVVIDVAELRRMSPAERRQLASILTELDGLPPDEQSPDPDAVANPYLTDAKLRRDRRLALLVAAGCCAILACWIVVLSATLPHRFDAHNWRGVWVNFDVILLAAFIATAWAIWRERQVLILLLVGIGTMLFCDAWFDVGTSWATTGSWISLASAAFAELPLAFLAFAGARRLLKATVVAGIRAPAPAGTQAPGIERAPVGTRGSADTTCSLRRTPLSGHGLDEALPRGRAHRPARQSA